MTLTYTFVDLGQTADIAPVRAHLDEMGKQGWILVSTDVTPYFYEIHRFRYSMWWRSN